MTKASIPTNVALVALVALVAAVSALSAPRATAAQVPEPLAVGDLAPDFSIPGATRYGVLAEPVTLREYAGKTVVLSFFFRARTKG